MKTLIAIALMNIMTLGQSLATSLHPDTFTLSAHITKFEVENFQGLKELDIAMGFVAVNAVTKSARLDVYYRPDCPAHMMCPEVLGVYTVELPIISIKTDSCGVVTYSARKNSMPVDGDDQTLIVKDNSKSVCAVVYPALTTVQYQVKFYDRINGLLVEKDAYFLADRLFSPNQN